MDDDMSREILEVVKRLEQQMGTFEQQMVTKEEAEKFATKADVREIPYIKQAVTESAEKINRIDEKIDERSSETEKRTNKVEQDMAHKDDVAYMQKKIWEHDRDIYLLQQSSNSIL